MKALERGLVSRTFRAWQLSQQVATIGNSLELLECSSVATGLPLT
jgi:hypothetical protein